jgi:hypothetical protein
MQGQALTKTIIGCAYTVHNTLLPRLISGELRVPERLGRD